MTDRPPLRRADRRDGKARLRTDGGPVPPALRAYPDPALAFEGDPPTVLAVNPAFEAAFDADPAGTALAAHLDRLDTDPGPAAFLDRLFEDGRADLDARYGTGDGTRRYLVRGVLAGAGEGSTRGAPAAGDPVDGWLYYTDLGAVPARAPAVEERLDEFADVLAHELRNPLDIAGLRLEAARETGDDVHFEKIGRAHDRMDRIIDDALTLARGRIAVGTTSPVDLEDAVANAWAAVEAGDATLATDGVLPTIEADPDRLQHLLENLFRNCIEHAGTAPAVRVGATGEGFYVADDGPGIAPDDRDRVFEPGYSGDGDSGLGLAIVDRIAEAHGWRVTATDAATGGARFEVAGVGVVQD